MFETNDERWFRQLIKDAQRSASAIDWSSETQRWFQRYERIHGWFIFLLWLVGLETCALLLFLVAWGSR